MFSVYGNAPSIEKDPAIQKLCDNVWAQIRDIAAPDIPVPAPNPHEIKFFSVEDAVKELLEMKKQGLC